jgi:hypothetical protein
VTSTHYNCVYILVLIALRWPYKWPKHVADYYNKITFTNPSKCIQKYKDIILHVVLYGCETWSLSLREERRLRLFENRVLKRRVFGPKREEVVGGR